ncbi:MAG: hypothetical protein HYZ58_14310 [Acidobacteria bacterium]|nr:hypothetical protein [Acidobacteriota bacterium]
MQRLSGDSPAWKTVAASSSLVGVVARAIAAESDELREEFDILAKQA